ncbi:MAG: aconitate hydratase [Candidatus Marinimicrobia bacterium]|nr:aconitate hydratase [Candidatus Neomarinimicrobiota bacterium]MCF7828278.1 aconitate hydratase [Candidatus Neomarinimicrobiota bacterium]MCF7879547.1 aconitate hydratase [Candidatus Neomarinimicrobiota bacterium]
MLIDLEPIEKLYSSLDAVHKSARERLGRSITLAEKILFSHMADFENTPLDKRGEADIYFYPDRVAMQDATAQMAILQFMLAGRDTVAVPTTVHCDHLIQAYEGAGEDLKHAIHENNEVYKFLRSSSKKYGIGFWEPGAGIIHQVVFENYAAPGTMMIGTDSHTPNAGGLGMIAIGVGGADAVDVMVGEPWLLRMPKLVGIHLKGELSGWTAPKDVILKVADLLTVKGGTGKIVEYFGEGTRSLSATGKGTITNMGAEVGATTSIFPFDEKMVKYLNATERGDVADLAKQYEEFLRPDEDVERNPEEYYDEIYEIDLDNLEPHIVGPHTPDLARPISEMGKDTDENNYPSEIRQALIGSCTNSSYEDLTRAATIARQAAEHGLKTKSGFMVTPGSERIYETIKRDGILEDFEKVGGTVLANACGPCIGQWKRDDVEDDEPNTIVTSFNRNFKGRNDGSASTHSFIGSPEIVVAMAFGGDLHFNPLADELEGEDGQMVKFNPPVGEELPSQGFKSEDAGFIPPADEAQDVEVIVDEESDRIALLEPFSKWELPDDFEDLAILVKAHGKCTTDHISPAGRWLRFRGHLDNISNNLFIGAVNAFTKETGVGLNQVTGEREVAYSDVARSYKKNGLGWVAIGDENYGEGSSREHAAMEPRHLGCRAVIAKSFARIAETNLKKQGILPLWFDDKSSYDLLQEKDRLTILNLDELAPNKPVTVRVEHEDGTSDEFTGSHTLSEQQIQWFYAGSALNYIRENS